MGTKIYVGNLLYETTDDDLKQLFSQFGEVVSAEIVRYKKSRRSKGFGYVKMENPDSAQQAITALNDQDYRGRKLFLEAAKSEDPPAEVMAELQQIAQTPLPERPQQQEEPVQAVEAQEAQQQQVEQQTYQEQQQAEQQVEEAPVEPAPAEQHPAEQPPQNYTPQEHLRKSGTIFSGGGDRTNNS